MRLFHRRDPIQRYCDWLTLTALSDSKYVPKKWREKGGRELSKGDAENLLADYLNFYIAYTDRRLEPILSDYGRDVITRVVASRCLDWQIATITGGLVTPSDPRYAQIYETFSDGLFKAMADLEVFPEAVPDGSPQEGSLYSAFGHFIAHKYAQTEDDYFVFVAQLVTRTATAHRLHLKKFLRSIRTLPAEALSHEEQR